MEFKLFIPVSKDLPASLPKLFNWFNPGVNPPKLPVFKPVGNPVFNPDTNPVFNPGANPMPVPAVAPTAVGETLVGKAVKVCGVEDKVLAIANLLGSFS